MQLDGRQPAAVLTTSAANNGPNVTEGGHTSLSLETGQLSEVASFSAVNGVAKLQEVWSESPDL